MLEDPRWLIGKHGISCRAVPHEPRGAPYEKNAFTVNYCIVLVYISHNDIFLSRSIHMKSVICGHIYYVWRSLPPIQMCRYFVVTLVIAHRLSSLSVARLSKKLGLCIESEWNAHCKAEPPCGHPASPLFRGLVAKYGSFGALVRLKRKLARVDRSFGYSKRVLG